MTIVYRSAALLLLLGAAAVRGALFNNQTKRAALFCPANELDPTVREILEAAVPWTEMKGLFSALSQQSDAFAVPQSLSLSLSQSLQSLLAVRPSFLVWLATGRYTVRFDEEVFPALSFADVHVVQESHFRHDPVCALTPRGLPLLGRLCHCEEKLELQQSIWQRAQSLEDRDESDKRAWCVRKAPCTSRDLALGLCEIPVDPTRRSCLLIEHSSEEGVWKEIEQSMTFETNIPTLLSLLPPNWAKKFDSEAEKQVKEGAALVLSVIPFYLFNLCVGIFLLCFAGDLAEDFAFQFVIQALVGVFFGLFLLGLLGHKILGRFFGASASGLMQLPTIFGVLYLITTQPAAAVFVRDQLFEFWDTGALGFPWLGKFYFATCLTLSWAVSRYFQVFVEDSPHSWFVLLTVKLLGVLFLSQSSSNIELCLMLVVVGLFSERIYDYYSFLGMVWEASNAPKNFVANRTKMSAEELKVTTNRNTQKALEDLRKYLQQHPDEGKRVCNSFVDSGKLVQKNRLESFLEGSYEGRPIEKAQPRTQSFFSRYWFLSLVVLVSSVAVGYFLFSSNFYE